MAEAHPALEPWTQRLVARPPWSPWRLTLALWAAGTAAFVAVEAGLGRLPFVLRDEHVRGDFRVALVLIAIAAYLPGAFAHLVRGARATIDALGPALRLAPGEQAAPRVEAGRFDRSALRRAGAAGVAAMLLLPFLTNVTLDAWTPGHYRPEALAHRALLPWIGWFGGRFVYALLVESRRLSWIGRTQVAVDLVDLRPLVPIPRQGLRHALLGAGLFAILALALADAHIAPNLLDVLAPALLANAALAAAALLLPVRGLREAVVAAKQAELDAAVADLRRARTGAPGARPLADVLAWRAFVEAVPEWPFDAPTVGRFLLYLAIPLGSWLGGALVERLLDALLS
jgi:hypothetical protein